jgi:hypothetical protein
VSSDEPGDEVPILPQEEGAMTEDRPLHTYRGFNVKLTGAPASPQPQPHKRGERVTVFWPNGPYDFVLEFEYAEQVLAPGREDWIVIHGLVVEPDGPQHRAFRGFYVHPVEGGYSLLPMIR